MKEEARVIPFRSKRTRVIVVTHKGEQRTAYAATREGD